MARKFALLVGNGTYGQTKRYSPLEKSAADVQTLAEPLRVSNIGAFDEVQILIDQPMHLITQAIERLFQEKKLNDLLLLYLTGHGDIDRRMKWYFVCNETQPTLLSSTAIPASFIRDVMDGSRSDRQIVILDTCYAGAFFTGAKSGDDITNSAPTQLAGSGCAILAATSGTQLAYPGDKQTPTSIFTRFLVQGLTTGAADTTNTGTITVDGWFDYASNQMGKETPDQTPRKQVENQLGSIIVANNPFWVKQEKGKVEELEPFSQKTKEQWVDEGIHLYEASRYVEALEKYKQALILDPEYTFAYLNRGKVFSALKDYQESLKNYNYALTFDPTFTSAYYYRGLLHMTNKKYQQAFDDFSRVLTLEPTHTKAREQFDEMKKLVPTKAEDFGVLWSFGHEYEDLLFSLFKAKPDRSVYWVKFSPDSQILASTVGTSTITLWNPLTGQELRSFNGDGMVFSPDGLILAGTNKRTHTITLWNPLTGQELRSFNGDGMIFSPDGLILASVLNRVIMLWNPLTGQELHSFNLYDGDYISDIIFSPNGQILAASVEANVAAESYRGANILTMWNPLTGQELKSVEAYEEGILCLAFSPNGRFLAVGSSKGMRLWGNTQS